MVNPHIKLCYFKDFLSNLKNVDAKDQYFKAHYPQISIDSEIAQTVRELRGKDK